MTNADCRHAMPYPVIADSGANFHMFKDKEFLDLFLQPQVVFY
jgi:hypothetical protein